MFALRLYIKAAEQAKTVVSYGGKTQTTYTDEFGRISEVITKKDSTELMRQVYAYKSRTVDGETLTSDQISSIVTTIGSTTNTESYTYDANGNIRTISKNGVKVYEYIYNSLNELTCEYDYTNGKKVQYSYDSLGNIRAAVNYNVTFNANGTETAEYSNVVIYGYDDANWADKATSFNGDSITYDASGNPTLLNGYTLSWKNGRQLASASNDGKTVSYTYDSNGIRTEKRVSDSVNYFSEVRDYTTIDGRITSETVSGGGMNVSSYDYNIYYIYNESGEVIGFKYNYLDYANYPNKVTENYSYVKNLQGDIVGIVNDATGEQVVSYTYDAWGNITSTTGTLASTIGQYNSMRYRGYYYDTETGMYYLQSRYYNPEMRRFINSDDATVLEIEKAVLNHNLFSYCKNEPINNFDPYGYWVLTIGVSKGIAAILGVNLFATLLIDSTWDYGLFLGATLLYGVAEKGLSGSLGIYWGFKKIKDYLNSVTVGFAAGYVVGGALVYNYYKYPSSKKKFVGLQISYGTTGLYRETAPFDGGLYIPLKSKLKKIFASCGNNFWKLKSRIKNLKIKVYR